MTRKTLIPIPITADLVATAASGLVAGDVLRFFRDGDRSYTPMELD